MTNKIDNPIPKKAEIKMLINIDPTIKKMFERMEKYIQPCIDDHVAKEAHSDDKFFAHCEILGHLHAAVVDQIIAAFKDHKVPEIARDEFINQNLQLATMKKIPRKGRN